MNKSDFPKEQLQLMQQIYDMRQAQKSYFKQQNNVRLRLAKAKEAVVDNYLNFFITNKLIDVAQSNHQNNQTELFNN